MTGMTFEELRDIWEKELRNQRVPSPVEPTLYDDMRILCERLQYEFVEAEHNQLESGLDSELKLTKAKRMVEEIARMRITKIMRLSLDQAIVGRRFAHLDELPQEELRIFESIEGDIELLTEKLGIREIVDDILDEIADELDGMTYPPYISDDIRKKAKDNNIQIVYGCSDDLIEFEGAFFDELGAWIPKDGDSRRYVSSKGRVIDAVWCEDGKTSWTYRTDIRHRTFRIFDEEDEDDDTPYCIGIIFRAVSGETWSEEER